MSESENSNLFKLKYKKILSTFESQRITSVNWELQYYFFDEHFLYIFQKCNLEEWGREVLFLS